MLVLDTNVLSEMMAATPAPTVAAWLRDRPSRELFTASVCQAEVWSGIEVLPIGRRRTDLERAAHGMFAEDFDGRILSFDTEAAVAYANMFAARRLAGRPSGIIDLMLAATASVHGASVVTRNVTDFDGIGLSIINPWND